MERGCRTVLFIDVVESVRLIEQDEDGIFGRWLAIVDQIEQSIVPKEGGRIVKRLGDGIYKRLRKVALHRTGGRASCGKTVAAIDPVARRVTTERGAYVC